MIAARNYKIWNKKAVLPKKFSDLSMKRVGASKEQNPKGVGRMTLIPGMVLALDIYAARSGTYDEKEIRCATGENDKYYFSEIEHQNKIQACMVDKTTGKITAAVVDSDTNEFHPMACDYSYAKGKDDDTVITYGESVFLAMMEAIMENEEAENTYLELLDAFRKVDSEGLTLDNLDKLNECFAVLSDNVFRRILKSQSLSGTEYVNTGDLPLDCPEDGKLNLLSKASLRNRLSIPSDIMKGSFKVFCSKEDVFAIGNEFHLTEDSELTDEEKIRVIKLDESHVVSETEYRLASLIYKSWNNRGNRINSILLEGPAGTGKTEIARALSSHLNKPYATFSCSQNTDESEIKGYIRPVLNREDNISFFNKVIEAGESDISLIPDEVYKSLTGTEKTDAGPEDIAMLVARKALDSAGSEVSYEFGESEVIKALTNGWILEIQEPTTLANPSVLVALNDMLNSEDGIITTDAGVFRRHPDSIVIYTTNRYASNVPFDNSVRDRVKFSMRCNLPSKEEMASRVKAKSLLKEKSIIKKMVDVISSLREVLIDSEIDAPCGMRSLLSWADMVALGESFEDALLSSVIYKISTDSDELSLLQPVLDIYGIGIKL